MKPFLLNSSDEPAYIQSPWRIVLVVGFWILFGLALSLLLVASCAAQPTQSLREAMFGRSQSVARNIETPKISHLSADDDSFVLDQSSNTPLMRFDGDQEVWILTPSFGAKGDVVYKNDVGEPMLRSSRWGGLTLISQSRPEGDPVALIGKARAIESQRIGKDELFQILVNASRRASNAVHRLLPFDAPDVPHGADVLFADAANNATSAIVTISKEFQGQKTLSRVREVRLIEGRPPGVKLQDGVLELKLDPSRGYAGRPSSRRVSQAIRMSVKLR